MRPCPKCGFVPEKICKLKVHIIAKDGLTVCRKHPSSKHSDDRSKVNCQDCLKREAKIKDLEDRLAKLTPSPPVLTSIG